MKFDDNKFPGGPFESLEDLNKALAAHMATVNNRPIEDFHGLSPVQMHQLLRGTFGPDSLLRMKPLTATQAECSPFYCLVVGLLTVAQSSEGFKATAKGNLPTKVCKELYAKKHIVHDYIESGIVKANKEEDFVSIHAAHLVCKQIGLLRKYKDKILLTKKAEKLLQPGNQPQLFRELIVGYCSSFNWAYLDRIEAQGLVQGELGFLLFLLLNFGDKLQPTLFYAEQCLKAFPILKNYLVSRYRSQVEELAFAIRIRFFDNFACWFGLAIDPMEAQRRLLDQREYHKLPLMDELFEMTIQ